MPKLLIATGNPGKVAEYQRLLGDLPCRITGLREEGIDFEVPEAGDTYQENARLKAEAYAAASGFLTLADDSGIEVEALGWAPGPLSARYGGPGLSDPQRVERLLEKMREAPEGRRAARFVCIIAIAAPEIETRLVRGECAGVLAFAPRGTNGFGYDPIFLLPDRGKTTAELSPAEKDLISHRGAAARAARPILLALMGDA